MKLFKGGFGLVVSFYFIFNLFLDVVVLYKVIMVKGVDEVIIIDILIKWNNV